MTKPADDCRCPICNTFLYGVAKLIGRCGLCDSKLWPDILARMDKLGYPPANS